MTWLDDTIMQQICLCLGKRIFMITIMEILIYALMNRFYQKILEDFII
jgi:hypothetical protein